MPSRIKRAKAIYHSSFAANLRSAVLAGPDKSNGYEEVSSVFIAGRGSGTGVGIGASIVAEWATTLPRGASVLDLGCGTGDPITRIFAEVQRRLIAKVAGALRQGGKFLFTATRQSCSWRDAMTERISVSLGHEAYQRALEAHGLTLVGTETDEGENYYYFAQKT